MSLISVRKKAGNSVPGYSSLPGMNSGFTLLEVCVVLFIIGVIFIVSVPPAAHLFDEERLRKPIRELQSFARTARRQAMLDDRAYELMLLNDGYLLRPVNEDKDRKFEPQNYQLPSDVRYEIKRVGDKDFKRQSDARWIFSSNGLCEPVTFLFRRKDDWVRFRVDPLTAGIQNQESFIK
jgi:prepilin-type N-terminal cleavage/methylation domain-containing protein